VLGRQQRRDGDEAERRGRKAGAIDLASRLETTPVLVKAKAGDRGKLFGAVTNAQVADALMVLHGADIDRHKIELPDAIKTTGDHPGTVRLPMGVQARITVRVTAQ